MAKKKAKKKAKKSEAEEVANAVADAIEETKVEARGPGAPTVAERRRLKAKGQAAVIDPNELSPQIPGVDMDEPTPAEILDPRLGASVAARASRRRNKIFAERAERGDHCRRPVIGHDGKPVPGASTSSV